MKERCPRRRQAEALREGELSPRDVQDYRVHEDACVQCASASRESAALRALFRTLRPLEPDEMRVRRVRASLLRAAAQPLAAPTRRPRFAGPAAALALVAAATVWMLPATSPTPPARLAVSSPHDVEAANVTPGPGAVWSRERRGNAEYVRLQDGSLSIAVPHQRPDERYIVELPDGELEVRGTRFDVNVAALATEQVRVLEGRVAWRRRGDVEVLLDAGQVWVRPKETPAAVATAASPRPQTAASRAPLSKVSPTDTSYAEAIALYRAGDFAEAARRFRDFVAAHPKDAEAEDASFLEAASLAQAGRGDAAALLAERFLERHPTSFHSKDASILVALAARDRGDCETARRALSRWLTPPSPVVAGALGRCAETTP